MQLTTINDNLELIVLPTEKCNFRCAYCYEDFAIGRMPAELVDGLNAFLEKRTLNLKRLNIEWFGGEPLLELGVIKNVLGNLKSLQAERKFTFTSSATTNAYFLTPSVLSTIYDLNLRAFQISLDGTKEYHDSTRRMASGRGTFDRIYENLLGVKQSGLKVRVILRVHLHQDNVSSVHALIDSLATDGFLADERFQVMFKAIGNWGGQSVKQLKSINYLSHQTLQANLAEKVSRLHGSDSNRRGVISSSPPPDYICYAAKPNALVVRADGRLAKCTIALDSQWNDIGKLTPDGLLEIKDERLQAWFSGYAGGYDSAKLACPWHAHVQKLPTNTSTVPIRFFENGTKSAHTSRVLSTTAIT